MRYQCPVCGYNAMKEPPEAYYICPCCGTEFENDDRLKTRIELTRQWVAKGMPWFSRATPQPDNWNPLIQMVEAGLVEVLVSNFQKPEPVKFVAVGKPINIINEISIGFFGASLSNA